MNMKPPAQKFLSKAKEFILDILFPKFCLSCGEEGDYLCRDCFSLIDISERQYCPFCHPPKIVLDGKTCPSCRKVKKLNGLYSAAAYNNYIIKKFIHQFKYSYIKELAKPLADLIEIHFFNLNKLKSFSGFILIPVPLYKKRLKERGFNQSEKIAEELSKILEIPAFNDVLIKTKQTLNQVDLKKEERERNIKGTFSCQKRELIKNKNILLVDDVFTTGSTMEESARVLKEAGAGQVWGIAAARG
jgi:ComF family protein